VRSLSFKGRTTASLILIALLSCASPNSSSDVDIALPAFTFFSTWEYAAPEATFYFYGYITNRSDESIRAVPHLGISKTEDGKEFEVEISGVVGDDVIMNPFGFPRWVIQNQVDRIPPRSRRGFLVAAHSLNLMFRPNEQIYPSLWFVIDGRAMQ
jgi:hypothetical protein